MHLKNAVAFKYQRRKHFMIHSLAIHLARSGKKIERDRFKQRAVNGKRKNCAAAVVGEMKNSSETIKVISWLFFNRTNLKRE